MMRVRATILALALLIAGAASVNGQAVQKNFQVAATTGYQTYDSGSGLKSGAWTVMGTATYYVSNAIGIGVWTDISFAEADGSKFPVASLSFIDSTTLNTLNQPLQIWNWGAHVKLQLPERTLTPYALLGGGGYVMFLDAQQQDELSKVAGGVVLFGLGADWALSNVIGVELALYDHFYPDWKPEEIYPADEDFIDTQFPQLSSGIEGLSESIHNFSVVLGVTVVPGR